MHCEECGFAVRWVLPEEAMALTRTSMRDIFREIECATLHFVESPEGFLLVCAESLDQRSNKSGEIRDEININFVAAQ